ncbi:chromatin assembly factor 1 subunit p90 [[Candida] anglica]|uniref:Chromatin assembly factor 1 subunit p90 n=1 Tax=[Candida] anglica TaxID=148631 RepID=A0ABP0EEY8_9ASCO
METPVNGLEIMTQQLLPESNQLAFITPNGTPRTNDNIDDDKKRSHVDNDEIPTSKRSKIDNTNTLVNSVSENINTPTPEIEENVTKKDNSTTQQEKDASTTPITPLLSSPPPQVEGEKPLTKKQLEKIERQKQREIEKQERDLKKEQERIQKEEDKRVREEERKQRLAEKEAEKELRRKKLEEEKLERDRKKEEERLKKLAEREEKEKQRLEKKIRLEEEKRKHEEEKRKSEEAKKKAEEAKQKSQKKISSFFTVNNNKTCAKKLESDTYDRVFLPFFQKTNVSLSNGFKLSNEKLTKSVLEFDNLFKMDGKNSNLINDFQSTMKSYSMKKSKSINITDVHVSPEEIVNALNSSSSTEEHIQKMVQNISPVKYLQFYENSKPPYIGTWCSNEHIKVRIPCTDPFNTTISGMDYEYDSDFEWNEDSGEEGEGEDIDNEDDDEEEEEIADESEFEDFVDSNDVQKRKKKFIGPLVSISLWNDGTDDEFFSSMKYEPIRSTVEFPIDPYGDYSKSKSRIVSTNTTSDKVSTNTSTNTSNVASTDENCNDSSTPSLTDKPEKTDTTATSDTSGLPTKKTVSTDSTGSIAAPKVLIPHKPKITETNILIELIKFVEENNDFTIGTLVDIAQKKFKSFTKSIIKNTIQDISSYNKKSGNWEINKDLKENLTKQQV